MPDGTFLDFIENVGQTQTWAYKITVEKEGIIYQRYACGSGYGKVPSGEKKLLIRVSDYDNIEYVGKPLEISRELASDVAANIG